MQAEFLCGTSGAKYHDQQRPQIVYQVGFNGWRCSERQKQQKVKAKQTVNAQQQGAGGHDGMTPLKARPRQGNQTAHQESATGRQKRGRCDNLTPTGASVAQSAMAPSA
jgi:hypothetical protein